ncbi:predicted protein [Chaetoceros tenuissimus]|uniref:Uncharacterized protein n=1 Tax=Chaetoceros tenuissimus TaxID=426638 RepID=A0AAD3H8F9_9STRA|nr:predicted protein [Chaetoceros tenuissimus]
MLKTLIDICEDTEYNDRADPMNHFVLINVRNVKWTNGQRGRKKMARMENMRTDVVIAGRDYSTIIQTVQTLGFAVLNESNEGSQIKPVYITKTKEESMRECFIRFQAEVE